MYEKRKKLLNIWRSYPNFYTLKEIAETITDLGIDEAINWQQDNLNDHEFRN